MIPPVVGLGAVDAAARLAAGAVTSVGLVRAYLDRIAAYDDPHGDQPGLRSVVAVGPDVLRVAARRDAERAAGAVRGPLHGVPVLVKDNCATRDLPTSVGSVALATYRTRDDAVAVRRLRDAGAVVLGKTNMSEFGWHGTFTRSSVRGEARNPYDQRLSTSGSSGGTAAAVAASFAAAGLGTDSCGSILGPSAHQGLVGFRPTAGLVPVEGVVPLSARQDAVGPMTTCVADAALLASVLAADPSLGAGLTGTALRGRRVGYFHWDFSRATPRGPRPGTGQVTALVDRAVADLAARGAEVVEVPFTREFVRDRLVSGGWMDVRAGIDAFFAATPARWPEGLADLTEPRGRLTFADVVADGRCSLAPETIASWLAMPDVPNPAHDAAGAAQEAGARALDAFFAEHGLDALAMPTSEAPAAEGWAGTTFCDVTANTGVPSISLPAGFTAEGLPVGLELVAPRGTDAVLLAMAHDYERATGHRRPPGTVPELPHHGNPHRPR
ncbi:amidase [Kineococcus radiotolerans]|uniref:Amidase n=1 Tax=Kineococcus radiotolerans TaxID=131568 RepID=A0A7W4TNZ6_KINRA|nr:amidase [Kineococcus radiotolerans]MBB2902435.1 amidase [Kineococcus radiotolerans]